MLQLKTPIDPQNLSIVRWKCEPVAHSMQFKVYHHKYFILLQIILLVCPHVYFFAVVYCIANLENVLKYLSQYF